jgi:hypothetical protein
MQPNLPFWFRQRQGKSDAVTEEMLRLTAPNMPEAFVGIQKDGDGRWRPLVRRTVDGENLASADATFETPTEAWEAGLEVYREIFVV